MKNYYRKGNRVILTIDNSLTSLYFLRETRLLQHDVKIRKYQLEQMQIRAQQELIEKENAIKEREERKKFAEMERSTNILASQQKLQNALTLKEQMHEVHEGQVKEKALR